MNNPAFARLRSLAREIAGGMALPSFYVEKRAELDRVASQLERWSDVNRARSAMLEKGRALGHGYQHAHRVAVESAAIVYTEAGMTDRADPLAKAMLIAGYMHDIRRDEKNHPDRAAHEIERIFSGSLAPRELEIIRFAVRNHEAFREHEVIDDGEIMLCANSLYDADKFRWGPDNFTDTIWEMAESINMPLRVLVDNYERGVSGIERIRATFRSETGKAYGPEFIDAGLAIARELFRHCVRELGTE